MCDLQEPDFHKGKYNWDDTSQVKWDQMEYLNKQLTWELFEPLKYCQRYDNITDLWNITVTISHMM